LRDEPRAGICTPCFPARPIGGWVGTRLLRGDDPHIFHDNAFDPWQPGNGLGEVKEVLPVIGGAAQANNPTLDFRLNPAKASVSLPQAIDYHDKLWGFSRHRVY
jgi:hypothetical protein